MAAFQSQHGAAIAPQASDEVASSKWSAGTGVLHCGPASLPDNLRPHIASRRYEGRPISQSPEQLRLHPALVEIGLFDVVAELNEAARSGGQAVAVEPVLASTTGTILAGLGRWRLALFEGTPEINCIEYPLDDEEALQFMLRHHRVRSGWNPFVRIEVALKLEATLQRKAIANKRAGGKYKGLANLPEAEQVDVRDQIAEIAGIGARNVGKVKEILKNAHPKLKDALRSGDLSINRAAQLCGLPKDQQVEELVRDACERATSKVVRQSIVQLKKSDTSIDTISVLSALQQQEARQPGSVEVRVSRSSSRTVILLGQDLLSGSLSQRS